MFWKVRAMPARDDWWAAGRRCRARRRRTLPPDGPIEAGDDVESGRLAGAVRADDAEDRALLDLAAEVVDGDQTAKPARQAAWSRAARLTAARSCSRSGSSVGGAGLPRQPPRRAIAEHPRRKIITRRARSRRSRSGIAPTSAQHLGQDDHRPPPRSAAPGGAHPAEITIARIEDRLREQEAVRETPRPAAPRKASRRSLRTRHRWRTPRASPRSC